MSIQTPRATLVIGTRGSKLALAQANLLREALLENQLAENVEITTIKTRGDLILDKPLAVIGGDKGLFVGEIEEALRQGHIDIAVHSAKDLPSELPGDMIIGAFMKRADPRDALISRDGNDLASLPEGALVGTSSPRRVAQLRALRPDLRIADVRGNVDTRLRKLHSGEYDAIVLAAAGLLRLGLQAEISQWLDPSQMLPAVGQGALAIEIRANDEEIAGLLAPLNDPATSFAVRAERSFLATVGGGCAAAVAAYGQAHNNDLLLAGMIGDAGGLVLKSLASGPTQDAEQIGQRLAAELLEKGGGVLLPGDNVGSLDD